MKPTEQPVIKQLESWKEIAVYLKRGVRTVQRWEKKEGLPVHRHIHNTLATVYAYEEELAAWWRGRARLEEQGAEGAGEAKENGKRWLLAGVVAAAMVIAAGVGYWWSRLPMLPFEEQDSVLISQFENRTGEEVFDGTLEFALERELSNSRFVNVVSRDRINDSLQLMKKPLDTSIDSAVGREVALRDGGIRALITGRVEKFDTTYVLSAALVDPNSGMAVASFSEDAEGQEELVPAIRRLAGRVRESLGEELAGIERSDKDLEKVSTPSLRALQLYSQGRALHVQYQWKTASEFYQQAVEEDPEFASAHIMLAYCLNNTNRQAEALAHAQRAFEMADAATDHERYFIVGAYFEFGGDEEKAVEAFKTLASLYPDDLSATAHLLQWYYQRGQPREALPYELRIADLQPHRLDHQLFTAYRLLVWGERRQAEPYLQRVRDAVSRGEANADYGAWLRLFPVWEHWVGGNLRQAVEEAEQVAAELSSQSSGAQDALSWHLGSFYLTLGKRQAAQQLFQNVSATTRKALVAYGLGDENAAREYLHESRASHRTAILLARVGLLAQAEEVLSDPDTPGRVVAPFLPPSWDAVARGELALARGQTTEATRLLEEGVRGIQPWPTAYFFLSSEALAQAWEQQGNTAKAVEILEAASRMKWPAIVWPSAPFFWMKNQVRLAKLYRKLGREQEASEIEAELRQLLALADPDHPILAAR